MELVSALKKPGEDIQEEINHDQLDALHMAIGICGEAGELADAIKKWGIYQKQLDVRNVIEELGDIEFFLEGIRQCLGIDREITLEANCLKLSERYASGKYSNAEAQHRLDKVAEEQHQKELNEIISKGGAVYAARQDGSQALIPVGMISPFDFQRDPDGTIALRFVYDSMEQTGIVFYRNGGDE